MKEIPPSKYKQLLAVLSTVLALILAAVTFSTNNLIPNWAQIFSIFGSSGQDADADYICFIDVGQGDSVLISSNGRNAMIDFGNNTDNGRALYKSLRRYGINTLDCIMVTHYDADHIGGADTVLKKMTVHNVILPEGDAETLAYRELQKELQHTTAATYTAQTGTVIHIGDFSLTIVGYYPDEKDDNDQSIVVMAEIEGKKFLFSGDAGKNVEKRLLADGLDLDCDVFKASHHGSRTGNSKEFIDAITPEYVVISCGAENSYGHPHQEAIDIFEKAGAEIYRTDESGDIVFSVQNGRIVPETEY